MHCCTLSWSAIDATRSERIRAPLGFLAARVLAQGFARFRARPLIVAGRFDRSAIMAAATYAAREHQARHGGTWGDAMSVCLRAAWQAARAARLDALH